MWTLPTPTTTEHLLIWVACNVFTYVHCQETFLCGLDTEMGRSMLLLLWCASIASLLAPGLKLLALAQQNRGFISIDSGANSSPDDNFKLYYEGDNGYTDSGENKQVSTGDMYTAYHQIARTLRSFPNGTRNCYTLKPDRGKNNLYLIRTYFWYGNYDRKNETPTFDLYIDVYYWTTISSPNIVVVEIMYVPRADYIQACVVDMGSGIPFISALELRVLNNSIYQIGSDFLKLIWRANMGTSNQSFTRSPVDVYDRIWWGNDDYYELSPSTGASATSLSNNNDPYKVPGEVLLTATTMKDGYSSLRFSWTPPKPYVPPGNWILYFHFAETQILRSGQQREFTVSINGNQFTKSVTLEYLKPVTVVSTPVTGSPINILISPTSNESPYPPILNAIEVYNIVGLPNVQTAEDDVKAINDTKATYGVNKESWQGDPCVPSNYTWDGLNCSYGKLPRIISLDLSSSNLRGNIHSSLSNLSELESLDLSNNQLWGAIPETLAKLPKLRNLNLSGNNLTGSVPKALKRRVADKTLNLSLDGNPDLCKADPCPQKKNEKSISVPVAASVSAFFVVLLCALATICLIKRKNVREPNGQMSRLRIFKYDEILTITENFRTEIGKGAFGKVYQGKLKEDTKVAVKVLSESSWQGNKQFRAEAKLLMTVYHGNLVSLIGYCDDSKNMVLIYEFMANGNLQQHLSGAKPNVLTWDRRLRIAVDVAQGLDYLHNSCVTPIIHRDIKTTNILLNENMQAKISDFGLSRGLKAANSTYESSSPLGTPGYLPPEYQPSAYKLNQKSDVYSFGIVLLELMTGQQAMMPGGEGEGVPIRGWATSIIKSGDMHRLMDRRLQGKFDIGSAKIAAKVAESCTCEEADTRPDISHVLADLKGAIELASKQKYEDGNQGEHTEVTSLEVDSDSAPLVRVAHSIH